MKQSNNTTHKVRTIATSTLAVFALLFAIGSVVYAQTYSWVPIGISASNWAPNGEHLYNTNSGSVVVGGLNPDGSLLLDVAGQVGASNYCDENGSNCFQPQDVQWKLNGNNIYNENSANVGIGTTNPAEKLHINGNALADAYLYTSDARFKTNITDLEGLDLVSQLRGVRFDWRESGASDIGLIAQEVEQVLPEVVVTDEEGYKRVDYATLVAPLIQAVNEQQAQIDEIRATINTLSDE